MRLKSGAAQKRKRRVRLLRVIVLQVQVQPIERQPGFHLLGRFDEMLDHIRLHLRKKTSA